jgi:cystathionine beta-lyase
LHTPPLDEFDFDTPVERRNTGAIKWNRYGERDVIPMWVADMDFASPPCIVDAIKARASHGVYGYTEAPAGLSSLIQAELAGEYDWKIDPEWIVWLPGLVTGLNLVSRAIGGEGDQVITATPVYPPFLTAPINQQREVVRAPLIEVNGMWTFDFDALDAAISPRSRLFLLCNPHNPVGRVFTRAELQGVADFCRRHDLILCADEVHCGLVLDTDKRHVPIVTLGQEVASRTITLLATSKTFNLPGLGCAYAIVPDPLLRKKLLKTAAGIVARVGTFGFEGTLAAYRDGGPWRAALLNYLRANRDLVQAAIDGMPGLKTWHVEATYLAWIDARQLGVAHPVRFFEDAGVGLYDGADFGAPGFLRLNFGCPRSTLKEALGRMQKAVEKSPGKSLTLDH